MGTSKKDIQNYLTSLVDNDSWKRVHEFQDDVVLCCAERLKKRLIGWMMHACAWEDDSMGDVVEKAFDEFESKHLTAYRRWRKLSNSKEYDESALGSKDIERRLTNLFLYYLVYGEIHDVRGVQGVFHLLYHTVLIKYDKKDSNPPIGKWLRDQGHKCYKVIASLYSKEEMLHETFHHDDFDDLCTSSSFVPSRWWKKDRDMFSAFDLYEEGSKFPLLSKLMALDTPTFIKYWVKSEQGTLNEKDRENREKWILDSFLTKEKDKEEVAELRTQLDTVIKSLEKADSTRKDSKQQLASVDHFRPSEEDYEDSPSLLLEFRTAHTQFETSKELLLSAEKIHNEAKGKFNEARNKFFRDRTPSLKAFEDAKKKFILAEREFEEAQKGMARAADGFKAMNESHCDSFVLESRSLRDEAEYQKLMQKKMQITSEMTRTLQHKYEDAINKDRTKFARKFKTFNEISGGWAGWRGYLTIFNHYSKVIYLHCLLIFPLAWLYFDWHNKIDINDFGGSFNKLVDFNGLMTPANNILLMAGVAVGSFVICFLIINVWLRWRTRGFSAPNRGAGTPYYWEFGAGLQTIFLWIIVLITELVVMKFMVLDPLKDAYAEITYKKIQWYTYILLIVLWAPAIILYITSLQFMFSFWTGIFGYIYALKDGSYNTIFWSGVVSAFDCDMTEVTNDKGETIEMWGTSKIVNRFCKTMLPKEKEENMDTRKKNIAFAQVWNAVINYFYDIHKLSKEELQKYTYKLKYQDQSDFLSGEVDKMPDLSKEPVVMEVKEHIIRFVNNVIMKKPRKHILVKEMVPLNILTPVGAEKILYPYDFITHIDNTQSSFLQHLIDSSPQEWINFKKKECTSAKSQDWAERMEKDILQGAAIETKKKQKRWIHNTTEGQTIKRKLCEWASIRFQALFRTVNGFMQVPRALAILARIQDPRMSQSEAEILVRQKFSYLMGYQSFSNAQKLYKKTKEKAKSGEDLTKPEAEAHDAVYNIKYIKTRFPEVKIAYPDIGEDGKFYARMMSGISKTDGSEYSDYKIELFGPFGDMGLGKPAHQNFLVQFLDGLVIQAIDVNQDNVLGQSFFVPNVLAEFDRDKKIKIIGCPEFIVTTNWSSTAWCSAFAEHNFGTMVQRCYARLGLRFHYGHPDYIDAMSVMTESGMSKMPYVSEDIFTGFDVVLKGGRVIHIEYHEVGKARDVDLYTTTKFQRKISMGASQMACTRYIDQLQTTWNANLAQKWSFYYTTVGFYINHQMLYLSVWFALVSQLVLVILQATVLGQDVNNFISRRVFFAQIGYALVAPGILQLVLEKGFIRGIWDYIAHFFILAVYATFHILNVAAYWQFGLTSSAFYLASGRGTGLEHYFMRDMYDNFYRTHWRVGFIIWWMGILVFALSVDWYVWILMYLAPSGVWLWGAMFLNPGSLPTTVHEEQWKRLTNKDMQETSELIKHHVKLNEFQPPIRGNIFKRFFVGIKRKFQSGFRVIHWLYTLINFTIHTRVVRIIALLSLLLQYIISTNIPTFIFTDERRRLLRWDDEDTRQKSIFYSTMNIAAQQEIPTAYTDADKGSDKGSASEKDSGRGPLPVPPTQTKTTKRPKAMRPGTKVSFE